MISGNDRTIVSCSEVSIGFGSHVVVQGVELDVAKGESILIIGHNGSGKTTLLRTLFGLQIPLGGSLRVGNFSDSEVTPARSIVAGLRYLAQGNRCFGSLKPLEHRRVLSRLLNCGLPSSGIAEPNSHATCVADMSIGERKLEAIEMLRAGAPQLFLLDEPMAGLDRRNQEVVAEWIAKEITLGTSFIIVEHQFDCLAKVVERVIVLRNGCVSFDGALADLLTNREHFAQVYL